MRATFPNQALSEPTITFAQAMAPFMAIERPVHRPRTPLRVTEPAAPRRHHCKEEITMDENRAAEFTGRVLADSAAAATIVLAALGDRTGLFKDLAGHGPATSG